MVIMCLVVLVPLVTCVHSIEVLGLARSVLVMPPVHLQANQISAADACQRCSPTPHRSGSPCDMHNFSLDVSLR